MLTAGGGIAIVLIWLLWQSAVQQRDLAQAELERERVRTEQVLARAVTSRAAFAHVPAAVRVVVAADGVPRFDDVGWLDLQSSALDIDLVVDDRIARATRAEFVDGDRPAAERAFAELLAAPLAASVRWRALAAAAWQAQRAGAVDRLATCRKALDEGIAGLAPADLGRPEVAGVVASALRLAPVDTPPPWAKRLAPFLPPELFDGLVDGAGWRSAHEQVVARRALLQRAAAVRRSATAPAGLRAVDDRQLAWWFPHADGGTEVALLTPRQWAQAVDAACAAGELPDPPTGVVPLAVSATSASFGGVPGLDDATFRRSFPIDWGAQALTGALVLLLGLVLVGSVATQARAARAEMRAVRAQSEFLTTVTHELKTPLAAIRLLGELLADGRAKGREAEYYAMLVSEAGRLSLLIENVLDLGRLERGERAYDLRPVAIAEVVADTLAMFSPLVERDGGVVQWHDESGAAVVRVDRAALVQALVAVLDNARKYGGREPRIDVTAVRADATAADRRGLEVRVRDRGPGVPPAERERIFERFVRGEAHAHGSTPGVGIGLYLARSIVHRLGGDLLCHDPLDGGAGACFTFRLPVEAAA